MLGGLRSRGEREVKRYLPSKKRFAFNLAGIRVLKSYDGTKGKTLGSVNATLEFGRSDKERKVEFLVAENVPHSIIVLPTLKEFNFSIDCLNHSLKNWKTWEVVACSLPTIVPKN